MTERHRSVVAIATPLQAELVARVAATGVEVLFEPDLLPPTRYPGDHRGVAEFRRSDADQRRWTAILASAEILFGLPGDSPEQLATIVSSRGPLRWVQATAAGAGEQVRAAGLTPEELERVAVTSASGVHAGPLAEFCLFGILTFSRGLPRLQADQRARHWDHYPTSELHGRKVVLLGVGAIGTEVARLAKAFGMRTIGVSCSGKRQDANLDEHHRSDRLVELASHADVLVISAPLTEQTTGLVSAEVIAALPRGAIVVNVGRGAVVDEDALDAALATDRLAGAALDVFRTEPLPASSTLWERPNVILSPHTAALSPRENERIVELFIENLGRYQRGAPLRNRIEAEHSY